MLYPSHHPLKSASHRTPTRGPRRALPLTLEQLESRTLMSAVFMGAITSINSTQISGWAYDSNDAAGALNVRITVNGSAAIVTANVSRPGLTPLFGSPYHGFVYNMPTLPMGGSTVLVQAISPSTNAVKTIYSGILADYPPVGVVDGHSDTQITGWAYDRDSSSPLQIRVDVNGAPGAPFASNIVRPGLASITHDPTPGFSITGNFAGKVVEVYAIDAPSGQAKLLWTNNKTPVGKVEVNNGYTVSGWADDPDSPSASINVEVDVDGTPLSGMPVTANGTRSDLINTLGSANHGFSVTIPGLTPGSHTISVYAIDGQANSAKPVLLSSQRVTDAPPVGHMDAVNSSAVVGWALDPDLGASPTTISVYVDDALFSSGPANISRPGLTALYGSPNHGFSVDLSSLPQGSHSITVMATDNRTSPEDQVVIYDGFINNHQPIGGVAPITGGLITGWAQDPDTATGAIPVDIYVDGAFATTTTANIDLPGLTPIIGSPDHGFSVALPALSFGTHRIDVYASESQRNVSTLIGTRYVTNSRPVGTLDSVSSALVTGWAVDPENSSTVLSVQVYINGVEAVSGNANITRPGLAAMFGSTDHGYSISLPTLSAGRNQIDVYAVDPNNGLISVIKSAVIMV